MSEANEHVFLRFKSRLGRFFDSPRSTMRLFWSVDFGQTSLGVAVREKRSDFLAGPSLARRREEVSFVGEADVSHKHAFPTPAGKNSCDDMIRHATGPCDTTADYRVSIHL